MNPAWVDAAWDALLTLDGAAPDDDAIVGTSDIVAVLRAVEPLIRADERGRVHATIQAGEIPASLYEEMAYDLRAQIAAEIDAVPQRQHESVSWMDGWDDGMEHAARIARGES